ncbi:hypothetical protein BaRGS_00037635 [Batillaria attramentaria]|uniref:Uncharacterized protein n=1 Tax=Batillaria attramentaria TaxID=370345 RepID=A0ABD0J806_9CAEN
MKPRNRRALYREKRAAARCMLGATCTSRDEHSSPGGKGLVAWDSAFWWPPVSVLLDELLPRDNLWRRLNHCFCCPASSVTVLFECSRYSQESLWCRMIHYASGCAFKQVASKKQPVVSSDLLFLVAAPLVHVLSDILLPNHNTWRYLSHYFLCCLASMQKGFLGKLMTCKLPYDQPIIFYWCV